SLARALVGDPRPLQVLLYARRRARARVAALAARADLVHAQLVRAATYLPAGPAPAAVVDLVDALSASFARRAARQRGLLGLIAAAEAARLLRYENELVRRGLTCLVVAESERAPLEGRVAVRAGSGLQNKVLEAMAAGTPVVATPRAVAGLALGTGEEVLVADDAAGLAAAAVALLRDPARARAQARAARALVERCYRWGD